MQIIDLGYHSLFHQNFVNKNIFNLAIRICLITRFLSSDELTGELGQLSQVLLPTFCSNMFLPWDLFAMF